MFTRTTTVTVLKDNVSTDAFGDEVDSYYAAESAVPAHIYETSRLVFDPKSGRSTVVKQLKTLLPASVTLAKGYRLKDETTETIYLVDDVTTFSNFLGTAHLEAMLTLVG